MTGIRGEESPTVKFPVGKEEVFDTAWMKCCNLWRIEKFKLTLFSME
jgi:hypothetical protein